MASNHESVLVNPIHPDIIDRMDPQFVEIYTKYQAPYLRADQVTIEEYRANMPKYSFPITPGPCPEVGKIEIHTVPVDEPPGIIKVQVYTPTEEAIAAGKLKSSFGIPAHVNYHGGGWVIGSLKSDESWCRQACQALGAIIVDVDYRLAPEYPFPAQVCDSWTALKWIFSQASDFGIDPSRVSVGGLSAGGHLAAVMSLLARDEPGMPPLRLQLLGVPVVDIRWTPIEGSCDPEKTPYESYISCEDAPCLPLNRMRWFSNLWIGTDPIQRAESASTWLASPIVASSHASLAPASIHCAEFDVLRSEGQAYHEKLLKAGTSSTYKVYSGVAHPFGVWDGGLDKGKEYVEDAIQALRAAFALTV